MLHLDETATSDLIQHETVSHASRATHCPQVCHTDLFDAAKVFVS